MFFDNVRIDEGDDRHADAGKGFGYDGTDAADADDAHMETRDYALGFGAPGVIGAAQHGLRGGGGRSSSL